jgi:hypothetical protein
MGHSGPVTMWEHRSRTLHEGVDSKDRAVPEISTLGRSGRPLYATLIDGVDLSNGHCRAVFLATAVGQAQRSDLPQ